MTSHDVRDMLDLPGSAGPRPTKKQKIAAPKPILKGLAREVQNLSGDNPIAIVPEISVFKKRRIANRKPAARWELKPFRNSARKDDLILAHWRRKAEVPPRPVGDDGNAEQVLAQPSTQIDDSTFAKFSVKADIPEYTDAQYTLSLDKPGWTKDETDYLMGLVKEFDLRWPVIWDRYEYEVLAKDANGDSLIPISQARTLEDLKARYYFIADQMLQLQVPLEAMRKKENDLHDIYVQFDPARETERKKFAENALNRSAAEAEEEQSLLLELKRITARQEKANEERRELYARLEAPPSSANIGIYTSSQGLQQLLQQLMTLNSSKKRRSLMGIENMSPASGAPQASFDRRDSSMRESISGPSGGPSRKGTLQGPERRELTKEEEKMYGVSQPTEKISGPYFRHERSMRPYVGKAVALQSKIENILEELGVPARRRIMPTAAVQQEWEALLASTQKLIDSRKHLEKTEEGLAVQKAVIAEREKKERIARGEKDPNDEHDVKMESDREKSVARSVRAGSVARSARGGSTARKRSASVMSAVSESSKRQKK